MTKLNQHTNTLSVQMILIGALSLVSLWLLTTEYFLYAFLPTLAVLGYFIIAKYPQLGIYLLIFQIPFGNFRKIDLSGTEINLSWVIAGILLTVVLAKKIIYKESFQSLQTHLWSWLFLFLLVALISAGFSEYPESAFNDLKLWIASIIYLALMLMLISNHGFKNALPTVVIASVFLSGFLGNLSFFFNFSLFTEAQLSGTFVRNLGGTSDANNLSLMIIATLPLITYRFIYAENRIKKIMYAAFFFSNAIAIATTYSRGGFLIFILALLFIAVEYRHYIKVKYFGFILLTVSTAMISFLLLMPETFWERQSSLVDFKDSSLTRRAAYIEVAADAVLENPILGSGPNSFYHIFARTSYAKIDKYTGEYGGRYAHNTYLEIIVGMGLVGLIIFLIILAKSMNDFTKIKRYYLSTGQTQMACYIGSCRLFLLNVLVYLLIFSETHHKFILIGLVMSQLAIKYYYSEQQLTKK